MNLSLNNIISLSHLILFPTIILSIIYLFKINFFNSILKQIKKDKLFLILINILFLLVVLNNNPFQTLVYYDEQNYVLQAQNIIEQNRNALCFQKIDDKCLEYSTAPHGILLNTVYSLFYNYDFKIMSKNIAIFSIILYLMNSLLMYTLTKKIFKNKIISRTSSIMILSLPYNIIYASNIMPATICNFLILIILIIILEILELKENIFEKNLIISLILFSLLISMTRIEYFAPFVILLIPYLLYKLIILKNKIQIKKIELLILFIPTILLFLFSKYYKLNKFETSLSLSDFNFSYINFFFSNWIYIILSVCFIISITKSIIKFYKKKQTNKNLFILIISILFSLLLGIYTLYRFNYVYRYLIPISSIFIILSIKGLYDILKKILKQNMLINTIIIIFLIISSVIFINNSFDEKKILVDLSINNKFVDFISKENLQKKLNNDTNNFIIEMKGPYLAQIQRLPNHLDNFNLVEYYLKQNKTIYYINSDFERIEDSLFFNNKEFSYEITYKDPNNTYNIYRLFINQKELGVNKTKDI